MIRPDELAPTAGWRYWLRAASAATLVVWSAGSRLVGGLVVISLAAGLIMPATAWLQRDVLDSLAQPGGPERHAGLGDHGLLLLVLGLGIAGVAATVLPQIQQYAQSVQRQAVAVALYDRAYRAVESWPGVARFESPVFADKLQLTGQLAQGSAGSLVNSVLGVCQALLTTVALVVTLVLISPLLALVTLAVQLLAVAASMANARRQAQLQVDTGHRVRRQQSYGSLLRSDVAAKEVRIFGLGGFLRGRMLAELRFVNDAERALNRRIMRAESLAGALSAAVIAFGLLWTVARVADGRLPVGDVSLFVMAAQGMQGAMYQIASALGTVIQSVVLFGAYTDVVSAPPDLPIADPPVAVPPLRRGVTVQDVWFRYDESHPWVLRGVSLFIPAGTRLGLVGLNGSGKTTLVKLLCRMYDPQRGTIQWDGVDIRELDPSALRCRIAAVFQDYMSYDLTAAENIGVGDLDAIGDTDAIRRAAMLAGADRYIARLPEGYDTLLSRVFSSRTSRNSTTAGVMVSGGQKQRIALARAFMRGGRDLLIADEPMSSLDAEAEHAINSKLADAQDGSTCVLISHRLASVRAADNIAVMSDGTVVEEGTHDELMCAGGLYARLFSLQAAGYGDTGSAGPGEPAATSVKATR